jgi:hypothetical protein
LPFTTATPLTSFTVAELISGQSFGEISVLTRRPLTAAAAFAAAMTPFSPTLTNLNSSNSNNGKISFEKNSLTAASTHTAKSNRFDMVPDSSSIVTSSAEPFLLDSLHFNLESRHQSDNNGAVIPCFISGEPISSVTAVCCTAVEVYCLDSDMLLAVGLQEDDVVCNALLQDLKYHSPPEEEIVSFLKEKAKWEMVKASIVKSIRAQGKLRS